jgi:hypothetical protein
MRSIKELTNIHFQYPELTREAPYLVCWCFIIDVLMQRKFEDVNLIKQRWRTRKANRITPTHTYNLYSLSLRRLLAFWQTLGTLRCFWNLSKKPCRKSNRCKRYLVKWPLTWDKVPEINAQFWINSCTRMMFSCAGFQPRKVTCQSMQLMARPSYLLQAWRHGGTLC